MTTAPPRAGAARAIWKHTSPPLWRKAQQMQRGRVCISSISDNLRTRVKTHIGENHVENPSLNMHKQTNFTQLLGSIQHILSLPPESTEGIFF